MDSTAAPRKLDFPPLICEGPLFPRELPFNICLSSFTSFHINGFPNWFCCIDTLKIISHSSTENCCPFGFETRPWKIVDFCCWTRHRKKVYKNLGTNVKHVLFIDVEKHAFEAFFIYHCYVHRRNFLHPSIVRSS